MKGLLHALLFIHVLFFLLFYGIFYVFCFLVFSLYFFFVLPLHQIQVARQLRVLPIEKQKRILQSPRTLFLLLLFMSLFFDDCSKSFVLLLLDLVAQGVGMLHRIHRIGVELSLVDLSKAVRRVSVLLTNFILLEGDGSVVGSLSI